MSTPTSDPDATLVRVEDDFTMMPYTGPVPGPRFPRSTYITWGFSMLLFAGAMYLMVVGSNSCGPGNQGCQVTNSLQLLVGIITMGIASLGLLLGLRMSSSAHRRAARDEARLQTMLRDI